MSRLIFLYGQRSVGVGSFYGIFIVPQSGIQAVPSAFTLTIAGRFSLYIFSI